MAWRRAGDKPLSEAMVGSLLTQIRVTRPQIVNCGNKYERDLKYPTFTFPKSKFPVMEKLTKEA